MLSAVARADRLPRRTIVARSPLQFTTPWNVFTPTLFRCLKSERVEALFKDGGLRLSSFTQFATHADEQRRDPHAGTAGVRRARGDALSEDLLLGTPADARRLAAPLM